MEDNGTGFSVEDIASGKASGYGIFNIRQRLKYFEGECAIESTPNRGAKIELTAPLAAERSLQ